MSQQFLSTNTPYNFVWHDSAGQAMPENSKFVNYKVSADGIIVNILDNAVIDEPIVLINSAANTNKSNNTINIGKNSQVQIIEYFMSDDNNSHNTVSTEINCSNNSQLKHCILQHASNYASINQFSTTVIKQAADSTVNSNIFSFGGGNNNINVNISLQGSNASSNTSCLAFTNNTEKQTVLLNINHEHPECTSNTLSRSVLKDSSVTDFTGRIIVHPHAKKSLADLQIKNLLCSPKAQANNRPELEIYNDDVRCSHGSTTGQIDPDALFYMRSRGIDKDTATAMLIAGFIKPVIDNCAIPMVAEYIYSLINSR